MAESKTDDPLGELMGYDKWPDDVAATFERDRGIVILKFLKNRKNRIFSFTDVVADFRELEARYVERFQEDPETAQQVRRITAEMLLQMSRDLNEPFETCRLYWHELQELGFYRIERKCSNTLAFARICCEHGQHDLGLDVLDPVIVEVERLRVEPNLTEWTVEYYEQELGRMRKLRVRLEVAREEATKI